MGKITHGKIPVHSFFLLPSREKVARSAG